MEIAEARTLTADELAVDDKAVDEAEAAATDAAELHASLKRQVVESVKLDKSKAVPVVEAQQIATFHAERADRIRMLADRAAQGRRLLALDAVAREVEQVAAAASAPSASIAAAVQKIADGHAELMTLCATHDQAVHALIGRAKELAVEPPTPSGPRASSAHIALLRDPNYGPGGIQSGSAMVRMVGKKNAAEAAQLAASGDAETALNRLQAARYVEPPKRFDHYYTTGNGMVHGQDDGQRRDGTQINTWPVKIAKGEARELDPDEVEAHLAGRFDGHQAQGGTQ
jgi:hypothetical protein